MASAVVSSVTNKLGALLIQEALVLYKVDDDVKWIQTELRMMQCFLKDADSRQNEEERVKEWVAEIIQVSYDAEDVIDTFICSQNALRRRRGFAEWVTRGVSIVGELLSELITHYTVGKKIEKIRLKIEGIKSSRETYGIRDINDGRQEASSSSQSLQGRRRLLALLEETEVVGQQEGINTVKEQLMSEESRRRVISIVGMGGVGKTTLAKKVYHDVKHDFDCHAFVYLSEQFGIKDVLIRIITCVMGLSREDEEKLNEDQLGMMLRDHLREKRYLLVIDDIWSTQAWDTLKLVLPIGMNKSRVMLTTRIKDVALHAEPSSHPHEMRLLNNDEGWELFMKKIFPVGDPSTTCPAELEETGRKILAKCGGLPLAISVLGGLLSRKNKTFSAWSKVLESVNRHLTESSDQWCRDTLALSFWDLPCHLKLCFLYFGVFLEDHEIDSERLIRLWIAEGFIPREGENIMEDVAEEYLEELVGRSMIQVAKKRSNGSIHTCQIHDLLQDLSISEARQNNFFTLHNDNGTSSSSTSVRRLALCGSIDGYNKHINRSIATLRSIFWYSGSKDGLPRLSIPSGKLLRVFDASRAEILTDPTKEGEFSNLRYLRISKFTSNESLYSFIGNLSNLQTLEISSHCTLPDAIWNLEELRHLLAPFCLVHGHPQLNNLRNLQTLRLQAGSWINNDLGKLTNLRDLEIGGGIWLFHKALSESVEKLCNLRSLYLTKWRSIPPFMPFTHHLYLYKMHLTRRIEELPELPPNLEELILEESKLEQGAISELEKLQHLKILSLWSKSYDSKKMVCSSGGFPRLEKLILEESPLEEWIVEEGAMPSIKTVKLLGMPTWKTLPEQIRTCSLKTTLK